MRRSAKVLDPRCDVDAVAKNIAVVDDDLTDIDADAKDDVRLACLFAWIATAHVTASMALTNSASNPIAGRLHNTPAVRRNRRIDYLTLLPRRASFVRGLNNLSGIKRDSTHVPFGTLQ